LLRNSFSLLLAFGVHSFFDDTVLQQSPNITKTVETDLLNIVNTVDHRVLGKERMKHICQGNFRTILETSVDRKAATDELIYLQLRKSVRFHSF